MPTADVETPRERGGEECLARGRILVVRDQQVMLDSDLAELYGVETRALLQQVRRNPDRFPQDFMFRLSVEELDALRSQSVMSSGGQGGRRTRPYAFIEQGVAMLSSVLRSERAVAVKRRHPIGFRPPRES